MSLTAVARSFFLYRSHCISYIATWQLKKGFPPAERADRQQAQPRFGSEDRLCPEIIATECPYTSGSRIRFASA